MDKKQIIIAIVILAIGVAIGRFTLPAKIVTITETKIVTQVVTDQHQQENKDQVTTITETSDCVSGDCKPCKTVKTTVIADKGKVTTDTHQEANSNTQTNTSTTTTYNTQNLMVSALVGTDALQNLSASNTLVFGVQVQKKLIGPIWIGAFGYSNKMVGGSIGLTF